ncbi:MAG: hypothetical protein WEA54_04240 [Actinomycetota bacterium]
MSDAGATTPAASTTADPLRWLASVLWPAARVRAELGSPRVGTTAVASYAIVPRASAPRLLVPAGAPRAASASLNQFNHGMGATARLRKSAAGAAFRLGVGARLSAGTLHIVLRADDGVSAAGNDEAIEPFLRETLGVPDAVLSITLGSVRPNAKPVVQVLRPSGRVVAFAKVAWNELTRALVDRENEVLRAWSDAPPRNFDVPAPIGLVAFGGFPVGIVSPAPQPLVRRGPRGVPLEVVREIADRERTTPRRIVDEPGWADLRHRIERSGDGSVQARARVILDAMERHLAGTSVPFGSWHGDLAPWNTTWWRGRWTVWDWERAAAGVPVGLDAVHWEVQVASHASGRDLPRALGLARGAVVEALSELRAGDPDAVLSWYFVERLARYEEARAAGTLPPGDRAPEGALAVLEGLA